MLRIGAICTEVAEGTYFALRTDILTRHMTEEFFEGDNVVNDMREPEKQTPVDTANGILRASTHDAIRRLACQFSDGVLTVTGTLPSYHQQQVVLATLRRIEGVDRINFRIEVTT